MPDKPQTDLADHLLNTVLVDAKQNRSESEVKWDRNRAMREVDPTYDPKGTWKKDEKAPPWASDTMFDVGKQKCIAAHSVATDAVLKDGNVPFLIKEREGTTHEQAADEDAALQADIDDVIEVERSRLRYQMAQSKAADQLSRCFDDAITYGETWGHCFVTQFSDRRRVQVAPGVWEWTETPQQSKAFEWVSVWEMYRDMEALDEHAGEYIIRRRNISACELMDLMGNDAYIHDHIKTVLEKQAHNSDRDIPSSFSIEAEEPRLRNIPNRQKNIEHCEFFARVPRHLADKFEREISNPGDAEQIPGMQPEDLDPQNNDLKNYDKVEVFAVTAGDEVIAYERDPIERIYKRVEWEPANDRPDGRGVPDNLEFEQKVLNGAIRSMENNAKLMASLVAAVKREFLETDPEDALGKDGAIIDLAEECKSANDAIQQITFESIIAPLIQVIEMFLQFSDMSSAIPRAEQGQQSVNPQTAFELQQRLERSGKYMGGCIRRIDELVGWVVNQFHDYNMDNPDIVTGKGDFEVTANGFTSFQDQVIRLQTLLQNLSLVLQSEDLSRITKVRAMWREILKSQDLDPDEFVKSLEQIQQEDEGRAQSEEAQLQLAALRADVAGKQAKAKRDDVAANKDAASIPRDDLKAQSDRARTIADIESKTSDSSGRMHEAA